MLQLRGDELHLEGQQVANETKSMQGHSVCHIPVVEARNLLQHFHNSTQQPRHLLHWEVLAQFLGGRTLEHPPFVGGKVGNAQHGQAQRVHVLGSLQFLGQEVSELLLPQGDQAAKGQSDGRVHRSLRGAVVQGLPLGTGCGTRGCGTRGARRHLGRSRAWVRGVAGVAVGRRRRHGRVRHGAVVVLHGLNRDVLWACKGGTLVGGGTGKVAERLGADGGDVLVTLHNLRQPVHDVLVHR
mmetsp:Transcript_107426/g.256691  ORF Transcript_107426/g.256691 Transcript_107426/m.256691 type:complete len:240 (-) Transcript_107426:966-1685(-)